MQELAPLGPLFATAAVAASPNRVHELQNQRAARADVGAPREEISADQGLQDAGLAAALAPDDGDLRQVDRRRASELREDVLELVDDRNHGVAEGVPGGRKGGARCRVVRHGLGFWRSARVLGGEERCVGAFRNPRNEKFLPWVLLLLPWGFMLVYAYERRKRREARK